MAWGREEFLMPVIPAALPCCRTYGVHAGTVDFGIQLPVIASGRVDDGTAATTAITTALALLAWHPAADSCGT